MKVGLYVMGVNHTIDKYYQILTLFKYMEKDPQKRFTVKILYEGSRSGVAEADLYEKLKYTYDFVDVTRYDINKLDLSCIFVIDPYTRPKIPYNEIKVPIVYKEYGVAGIEAGTGYLFSKPVYKYADMIITDSQYMCQRIKSQYPDKFVLPFSPAFDYIFDYYPLDPRFDKPEYHTSSIYYEAKYHILWTPHHSLESKPSYDKIEGGLYSTFLLYKDYLPYKFLEENPDVVLHIKYHPILPKRYNAYCKHNQINDTFARYLKRIQHPRVFVHDKEDYHALFDHCDLCLNDSISFTLEWFVTKKPMIILESPQKSPYSEYGQQLIDKNYTRAFGVNCLSTLVRRCLMSGDDSFRDTSEFFYEEGRPNSERILEVLFERYSRGGSFHD